MKLLYIIATLAALAMLIPAAVPVSAANYALTPAQSHDILGDVQRFEIPGGYPATSWNVSDFYPGTGTTVVAGGNPGDNYVEIQAITMGETTIIARVNGDVYSGDKKWGKIDATIIDDPQDVPLTWNESAKEFWAETEVTDQVIGTFWREAANHTWQLFETPAEGAVLHWFLLADSPYTEKKIKELMALPEMDRQPADLLECVEDLPRAYFAEFSGEGAVEDGNGHYTSIDGTSDGEGKDTQAVESDGEEPVLVVVVPDYPNIGATTEIPVQLEWTKINFWTYEMEKVPQVRWAGEKIVLEKFFGTDLRPNEADEEGPEQIPWFGTLVRFSLENQSPGSLEAIGTGANLGNFTNTAQTVWSIVGEDGYARCMLVSEAPGEVDVDLAVYNENIFVGRDGDSFFEGTIINQHGFVVFYLKLEEVTLGNVEGKRAGHYCGPWTPPNPWDTSTDIPADPYDYEPGENVDILNVSQDALLRARVKGWFMGDNLSNRPARPIDSNGNGLIDIHDVVLPAGRWVLPDDWEYLAGALDFDPTNWMENRLHWDIMDNPFDSITSVFCSPLGPYFDWSGMTPKPVAEAPVVGPFRPGIELPTECGYDPCIPGFAYPEEKTVVPNGVLEWWDAPMPPAKITFKILDPDGTPNSMDNYMLANDDDISDHAGFFKETWKEEVYYLPIEIHGPFTDGQIGYNERFGGPIVFTNPFYATQIPAFEQIPAFVNNGGYDWDSWDEEYDWYGYWWILNRPPNEVVASTDSSNFPTKVQVYSDNHGEAMVYLNGDFNLNLWPWFYETNSVNVPQGAMVGMSTVVAIADYPYFRKHVPLVSNPVEKDWLWGGEIRGTDSYVNSKGVTISGAHPMILAVGDYTPDALNPDTGTSNKLMAFVWLTDRDNLPYGVEDAIIAWDVTGGGSYVKISGKTGQGISSFNSTTQNIWLKNGFLDGTNGVMTSLTTGISTVKCVKPSDPEAALFLKFWPTLDPTDYVVAGVELLATSMAPEVILHTAISSTDFGVYPGLVGEVDRYITMKFYETYPLDDIPLYGDANIDGVVNMGDVTAIERTILGLMRGYIGADANLDTVIDMGDVVKIERMILGLD